ncbi:MAG: hypothetical protein FJ405_03920, partial [Verrucomicrobia bacterium]|nr:hypothetical protein [Verrucomicrobiota bacterium]
HHDLADPFVQSGTLHVFAISGLHIALIAWIAVEGFRAAGLRRRWAGLTALPLLWTYAWVTGAQPSAIRSAVMMTVVTIGWALERPGNAANSLCGAAVILLLWDPQQLFQPGFQLSFCVVLCLSTLSPRIHTLLEQWFQRPLLTPTPSVWRERLGFFQRWLIGSFSVSLAAWLGSLPLIAAYFHIVNPVSLVANLIVVPLSSICLAGCAGSLLVYPFAPVLSDLFNHGSWFWMRLMMICSDWAAGIPGAWFHAPEPGWVAMALWWAGLALCWLWPKISPITRRYVSTSIACGWLGVFASFVWDSMPTRLSLVPRRTGATLVVDPPGWGGVTLLDPGDIWFSPRVLVPFLRSRGINRIENLVITHASAGAITGASSLEKPFWVGSRHGPDGNYRSPAWRDWVKPQPGLVAHPRLHSSGQKLSSWEVLHPPRLAGSRVADDASLVLRGDFSGVRILWIPPLSAKGQNELLRSGLDLTADIVIAQLPGRGEALLDPLLDAIQPGSIIIGDGKEIQSFSRVAALKHRLRRRPVDLFFTSESGFLEILIRSRSFKILASRKTTLPESTSWDGAEPNEER